MYVPEHIVTGVTLEGNFLMIYEGSQAKKYFQVKQC